MTAAEQAGCDLLLTTDKNLRYQQNLMGRKLAILVLGRQLWLQLRPYVQSVVEAINTATHGSYVEVEIPGKEESA